VKLALVLCAWLLACSAAATVILDSRHRIVARVRGTIDWDSAAIDEQLQTLLK
jgi:hypothetical protein